MKLNNMNWETGKCVVKFTDREFEDFKKNAMRFCRVDEYTDTVADKYFDFIMMNNLNSIIKGEENEQI